MIRKAFRMSVNQGREGEYERRHNPIWPELEEALLRHGVRTYSIYLDPETLDLFGYAEIESEELWQRIAHTDVCGQMVALHEGPDADQCRRQSRVPRSAGGVPHRASEGVENAEGPERARSAVRRGRSAHCFGGTGATRVACHDTTCHRPSRRTKTPELRNEVSGWPAVCCTSRKLTTMVSPN